MFFPVFGIVFVLLGALFLSWSSWRLYQKVKRVQQGMMASLDRKISTAEEKLTAIKELWGDQVPYYQLFAHCLLGESRDVPHIMTAACLVFFPHDEVQPGKDVKIETERTEQGTLITVIVHDSEVLLTDVTLSERLFALIQVADNRDDNPRFLEFDLEP